jgi:hypothetical protein
MRHLVYSVRYSVLTVTLNSSVRTTLVYNDTKYSVPFKTLQPSSTPLVYVTLVSVLSHSIWCYVFRKDTTAT